MILNDVISQLERKERADLASQVQRAIHRSGDYTLFSRFDDDAKTILDRQMPSSCVDQILRLIDRKKARFEIFESPMFSKLLKKCNQEAFSNSKNIRRAVKKVIKNTVIHRCTSIADVQRDKKFLKSLRSKLRNRTSLKKSTVRSYTNHFKKGVDFMVKDRNLNSVQEEQIKAEGADDENVDDSLSSLKLYCFGDTLSEPIRVQIPEDATQKHVDQIIAHLEAHKKQADNG